MALGSGFTRASFNSIFFLISTFLGLVFFYQRKTSNQSPPPPPLYKVLFYVMQGALRVCLWSIWDIRKITRKVCCKDRQDITIKNSSKSEFYLDTQSKTNPYHKRFTLQRMTKVFQRSARHFILKNIFYGRKGTWEVYIIMVAKVLKTC